MLDIVKILADLVFRPNLCQVDSQINVGEALVHKFSSYRPFESTLTAGQSLVKRALTIVWIRLELFQ